MAAASVWAPSTASAAGTAHYVNCSAASNGNGSQTSPWNTLNQVDSTTFAAGDQILLARGTTCNGTLAPKGSGAAGAPIVVDAYGSGPKPVVAGGGASDAVLLDNQQYWEIRNLEVTNHGATAANRRGVHIVLQDYGTGSYYRLTNLTVHDVNGDGKKDLGGSAGIQFDVLGTSVKTKFNDVVLNGNDVYTVDRSGINMSTTWYCRASIGWIGTCQAGVTTYYPWTGFVVRNNTVHDIGGDGIVMQYTQNGLAENNVAYDTSARSFGSNAAIWVWNADNVTFQYNEAYQSQKLSDNNDGMAWDADFGTDGTVYQYNYSHDNAGGMAMFCGCSGGTASTSNATFRYNVSQNDGSQVLRGAGVNNGWFYNNTIYEPAGSTATIIDAGGGNRLNIDNNIIVNQGSGGYSFDSGTVAFSNNILSGNQSGAPAGQIVADPKLVSPGSGGTGIGTVAGYQIQPGSPAIGAGRVLPNNGGRDFWGHTVPAACAPDIGADQLSTPNDASCAIAKNGGFESGSLAPWNAWNSASVVAGNAHSGSYALQVGPAPASAEQAVAVAPDTTYQLSGWAKTATAGERVRIGVKNYGGAEAYSTITNTSYTSGSVTFHTGPSSTQATIYCYKASGAGYADCDDVSVNVATAPSSVIKGVPSMRCADVPGANTTDGTQLALYDCGGSSPNQIFARFGDGTLRTMGKCLTAASSTSLTPVTISTCNSSAGQQWSYDSATQELSPYAGMCLDASGGGTQDNTQLIIYACNGHPNQQWSLTQPNQ
ncbi:ricin-type beta-trefoil lectin domain protein [Catenulispora rubra]|uniref:ricin-type beta-trefoil lectin domain protein n=1 Tax=Catenulispora rubra TaxID=280293 RepID=UPI0018925B10|nr:ricin-type beta-trefoil lectin domain protein [Catenulispora rubra]